MEFKEGSKLYAYEVKRQSGEDVLYINYLGAPYVPSFAEYPEVLERTIDVLIENPNVSRIVLVQQKNYNYDFNETSVLLELANLYVYLIKQEKILSQEKLILNAEHLFSKRYNELFSFLFLLKSDPVSSFIELKKIILQERIFLEKIEPVYRFDQESYIYFLEKIFSLFGKLKLIEVALPYLEGYIKGDREIYNKIFKPDVIPNFTFTRLVTDLPHDAEIIDQYKISQEDYDESIVTILKVKDEAKLIYKELNTLATILVRHTIGFGLIEILLQDEKLQDIALNAPIPLTNIFLRHQEYDECSTNILPSSEDVDSWAAKFRMISGRPLDEANPVLDTQLTIGKNRARIAIIQRPLSPDGLAYSIRRHRDSPWTLPLFIKHKMINPFSAGLLSFLIDGSRTLLVAGTRSSGKTSLLGSLMLEIIPRYRIIVLEDSLELPIESLRKLKYDILSMKVRSALLKSTTEVSADDGIRTSLRLGDSCLIIGEVRSSEAKALYEAMRVGALANVVAGTIHGASAYGVFDRVVNDLEVPATSFKATDIIAVANPVKTPDGLHSWRRLKQITEVRKHWKEDPLREKGFVDLVKYNVEKDELEATDDLINGDSEIIKDIASNVKCWAGNWDAVYDNILLRAKIKNEVVRMSQLTGNNVILEAEFNTLSNHAFHKISDEVHQHLLIIFSLINYYLEVKNDVKRC